MGQVTNHPTAVVNPSQQLNHCRVMGCEQPDITTSRLLVIDTRLVSCSWITTIVATSDITSYTSLVINYSIAMVDN